VQSLKRFVKTSLIGGLIVLLPVGILVAVFLWIFNFVKSLVQPLTNLLLASTPLSEDSNVQELLATVIVLVMLVAACFVIGVIVRTQVGRFIHGQLENRILAIAPGYNLIKETVLQFLGNRPSPFSSVALARIFGNETMVTAFVTERHENGWYSVFVPTGPNPTSGNIYHLKPEYVHHVDQPIEDVMRSIISCGAGSAPIIKALEQETKDAGSGDD